MQQASLFGSKESTAHSEQTAFCHPSVPSSQQPLAERMRPQFLKEMFFSDAKDKNSLLEGLFQQTPIPCCILWGPPGSGKTTLARLLAQKQQGTYFAFSAVHHGVKDLRTALSKITGNQNVKVPSLVFIDEMHRCPQNMQDILLPVIESGQVVFLAATTENPHYALQGALLSRCQIIKLQALNTEDLLQIMLKALNDSKCGLAHLKVTYDLQALKMISLHAQGDARRALGCLEWLAKLAASKNGQLINIDFVKEYLDEKRYSYDKNSDLHYQHISALIKSLRQSEVKQSMYYLVRMLEAGEDPIFIFRRLMIFASEDIGHADPTALLIATQAHQAFTHVGMPEGRLFLSQAVLHLAQSPKSRQAIEAYDAAFEQVNAHGNQKVPKHLQNNPQLSH